ncbi:MAG: ribosome-associated translation inhibitor RaiA [Defluviitaleaceae bacterium]|nr:ribosome-associated translation inhibitor RaiA [Defluviitaleaceae bacterium]
MRYSFTGKGITVGEALKQKTTDKLDRLSKFIPENSEVFVTFTSIKSENKIEITIPLKKNTLRAEVADTDIQTALDQVVDILEKQMLKFKSRLSRKAKIDPNFKEELLAYLAPQNDEYYDDEEQENENSIVIKRSKKFALKPMDAEEAVMNMELLGHSFFVFRNTETDEVNVVYRRKDNAYGLIEPEY